MWKTKFSFFLDESEDRPGEGLSEMKKQWRSLIGCVDYLGVRSEEVYLMWSLGKFYVANLMYFFKFAWNVFKQHQYTEVHLRVRYSYYLTFAFFTLWVHER